MNRIGIGLTLTGLALASLLSAGALAQATQRTSLAQNPGNQLTADHPHPGGGHRHRHRPRPKPPVPPNASQLFQELQLSQAQREQALATARTAESVAQTTRREMARAIWAERSAAPKTGDATPSGNLRERLKAMHENAFQQLEPQVRTLIATLTPEQRAKLEARAKEHGVTFDENRFAHRLAFRLSRPMAVPMLEASLGR
jgi:hypothetical protein